MSTPDYPWLSAQPDLRVQKPVRLPEDIAVMLKWLAGSTYGETEQAIAERAIRSEIARMMREKGVPARYWKARVDAA